MDKAREEIDQAEDIIYKQKRELNDIRNMNDSLESESQRLKKQKLKLQSEVDQLNAIFESERNAIADLQLRLKKQGKVSHTNNNTLFFLIYIKCYKTLGVSIYRLHSCKK